MQTRRLQNRSRLILKCLKNQSEIYSKDTQTKTEVKKQAQNQEPEIRRAKVLVGLDRIKTGKQRGAIQYLTNNWLTQNQHR